MSMTETGLRFSPRTPAALPASPATASQNRESSTFTAPESPTAPICPNDEGRMQNDECRNPHSPAVYAKRLLVEEIMALIGRASANPAAYRRVLEDMDLPTLRRTRDGILDAMDEAIKTLKS